MRTVLIILLLLAWVRATPQHLRDSSQIEPVQVPAGIMDKYSGDSDFDYVSDGPNPDDVASDLWSRFINYIWYIFSEERAVYTIAYIAALVVLFVIVYVLVNRGMDNPLARNSEKEGTLSTSVIEDIRAENFLALAKNSIRDHKNRDAIRFLYLHLLRLLTDKELIEWRAGKTNLEYAGELNQHQALQEKFRKLCRYYEYTWYGEFPVSDDTFELIHQQFNESYGLIHEKAI